MNTTTSYLRAIGRERELLFLVAQRDSTLAAYQAQEPCPHGHRKNSVRGGKARPGAATRGKALPGEARRGRDSPQSRGPVFLPARAGKAWRGLAGLGVARHGMARQGKARQGNRIITDRRPEK